MPSSPSFAPSQPPKVRELLETDAQLASVGVAEVLDHLVRVVGADEEEATLDLAQLGQLDGTVVGSTVGAEAGRLRARGYHRARCAVSMADCIAAQTARPKGNRWPHRIPTAS